MIATMHVLLEVDKTQVVDVREITVKSQAHCSTVERQIRGD